MGAKDFPEPFVAPLAEQVQIDFTQRRQEAVGVGDNVRFGAVVAHLEAVVDEADKGERHSEQTGVDVLQREAVFTDECDHFGGVRPEGPDDRVVAVFVGAQDAVRIVVLAGYQSGQVAGLGRQVGPGELVGGLHRGVTSCAAA